MWALKAVTVVVLRCMMSLIQISVIKWISACNIVFQ